MTSTKITNRFQVQMNALRQRSNSKWKQFSNFYAKILIRFPWSILALSSFLTIGLTIVFFLLMKIRSFDQTDFFISNGQAMKNAMTIKNIFGDDTRLRMHQQLHLYPGLDIIIKRKANGNQTNMLTPEIVDQVRLLDKQIQSFELNKSIAYNYSSLCIKMNYACVIDGNYILSDKFYNDLSHLRVPNDELFIDSFGANGVIKFMFGNTFQIINASENTADYEDPENEEQTEIVPVKFNEIVSHSSLLRLRYTLNISTEEMKQNSLEWERQIIKHLTEDFQSDLIEIYPSTSTALSDLIKKKSEDEGIYLALMILVFMVIYHLVVSFQGNFHTSTGYLPFLGIVSTILSTGSTFGVLTLCQIEIIEPMALLVLVMIIIDCIRVSILSGEYHEIIVKHLVPTRDTSMDIDIDKVLPSIIERTQPYFLSSSIILIVVYSILAFLTPIDSMKFFCLTLTLFIFMSYLVHLTFFSSCFVITLKRISSYRHCLFCYRLPTDYQSEIKLKFAQLTKLSNRISELTIKDSIWKKFLSATICLVFLLCLFASLWLTLSIDTRLYDHELLPNRNNSLYKYMQSQINDFAIGPMIMFVIPEAINYENEKISNAMHLLLNQCQNEKKINKFKLFWLDKENLTNIMYGHDELKYRLTPYSHNDLIVVEKNNQSIIKASRFYCQYNSVIGDRDDLRTMMNMYGYTSESLIPNVFPYSLIFPSYESLGEIRMEIALTILFLIICCFLHTTISFLSFRRSLFIILSLLMSITGTLACLYLFHQLTWNFANAFWFYIAFIVYVDIFIHLSYNDLNSKWKYNRSIIALILSLMILYIFPIESYVFRIIRHSLIYQSLICLILINLIYPVLYYLFERKNSNEEINIVMKPVVSNIEGHQALTNGLEI